MLKHISKLVGYRVHAVDGYIGKVQDFYFDDTAWAIRYLLVEAHFDGVRRRVMIAPAAFREPDWDHRHFRINVTSEMVRNSPDMDAAWPVPLRHENELAQYYRWPVYWTPASEIPRRPAFAARPMQTAVIEDEVATHQLLSVGETVGFSVHAPDGVIGGVADFIVDDIIWNMRYLDIRLADGQENIRLAPGWVQDVADERRTIEIGILRANITPRATYDFRDESRAESVPKRGKGLPT